MLSRVQTTIPHHRRGRSLCHPRRRNHTMCGRFVYAAQCDENQLAFPQVVFPNEIPLRYNIAPGPGHHGDCQRCRAAGGRLQMGTHSIVGKRPQNWQPPHQCTGRNPRGKTLISHGLQKTAVSDSRNGILRMATQSRRQNQNPHAHRAQIRRTLCLCGPLGIVAFARRTTHPILHHNHNRTQRP